MQTNPGFSSWWVIHERRFVSLIAHVAVRRGLAIEQAVRVVPDRQARQHGEMFGGRPGFRTEFPFSRVEERDVAEFGRWADEGHPFPLPRNENGVIRLGGGIFKAGCDVFGFEIGVVLKDFRM